MSRALLASTLPCTCGSASTATIPSFRSTCCATVERAQAGRCLQQSSSHQTKRQCIHSLFIHHPRSFRALSDPSLHNAAAGTQPEAPCPALKLHRASSLEPHLRYLDGCTAAAYTRTTTLPSLAPVNSDANAGSTPCQEFAKTNYPEVQPAGHCSTPSKKHSTTRTFATKSPRSRKQAPESSERTLPCRRATTRACRTGTRPFDR